MNVSLFDVVPVLFLYLFALADRPKRKSRWIESQIAHKSIETQFTLVEYRNCYSCRNTHALRGNVLCLRTEVPDDII